MNESWMLGFVVGYAVVVGFAHAWDCWREHEEQKAATERAKFDRIMQAGRR